MVGLRSVFFFQAEDGIRDVAVTGVQTCALPILRPGRGEGELKARSGRDATWWIGAGRRGVRRREGSAVPAAGRVARRRVRSEERRVGKECRSRWSPYH